MKARKENQVTVFMRFKEIIKSKYRMFLLLAVFLPLPNSGLWAYPVPDTGQTKCYSDNETAGEIACPSPGQPFYGQDAQYNFHPRSYTKLDASGNALPSSAASWTMVRDNVTGLIWEMKTDDNSIHDKDKTFTWCDTNPATNGGNQGTCGTGTGDAATDTKAYINALNSANYGGHNDWRMPTVKELSTLVNSSIRFSGPTIDAAWFPNTVSYEYWSSTASANDSDHAWHVDFYFATCGNSEGNDYSRGKSESFNVRAVRGSQSSSNLIDNGNGTVTDTATGLMWQKATAPGTYTWEGALAYCENLNLTGHTDWRLPDRNELQSLVDYSRYNQAIDPLVGSDIVEYDSRSFYYWSSSTNIPWTGDGWFVDFKRGSVSADWGKGQSFNVRAVRSTGDTTPDTFAFTDRTGVALNTVVISNTITVYGIDTTTGISISGGTYSINGGAYSSASGAVNNGNTVTVRQTSSGSYSTTTNATLTIGGVSDTFSVTTQAFTPDTTPDQFAFTDQTGVALNTTINSNTITLSGINSASPISITGGKYSVNGGSYTSAGGSVNNGNAVTVQLASAGSYSTTTNATLTIGGVSDTFSVTTTAGSPTQDTIPDQFTFTDQTNVELNTSVTSNTINVSGINAAAPVSIIGGTYSINGGSYKNGSGSVNNGNTVTVKLTSSGNYSTKTDATLNIGGISDTFSVTTKASPSVTPPNPFTFNDQTGVALNTGITSNSITVSGITAPVPISITGGTYSVNGGSYTSASGTANNGDTVTVQVTSSASYSSTTEATLTIGGVSDIFSVTTKAKSSGGGDGGGGGGCFIATAAFGSPQAGQVEILRQFRDKYLLTNAPGKKFVDWYYRNGPVAAKWINDKPVVKAAVRVALYPLIGFSFLLISGYLPFVIIGLLLSTLLFLRFRPEKISEI